jgi:serine/threonine-protein kinase HipA
MPIHLVGETIDKARSHYQAGTGKLVQLMRGIYVDAADDIDAVVLTHAIRIAKYLYPSTYLSAASAVLLGPTRDGRLFLSGRRNLRTRIRGLEIIQNTAPGQPSTGSAVVTDSLGEFHVDASSMRQRFLEAFRLRSEHAASLDETMRDAIAARLVEEYGSSQAASDAVWALARANEWHKEADHAERYLLRRTVPLPARNPNRLDLTVAWHGVPIGVLTHDGFEWRWSPLAADVPPLVRQTAPGKLPPFIVSLLPEGWLEAVLSDRDERTMLRSGSRYMSNITVVENRDDLAALPPDLLLTRLDRYMVDGIFKGTYAGPGRTAIAESFERNLAKIYERADTPRLSGVQIKAPMHLDPEGRLSPSSGTPFTHILKPAGAGGFETLPLVEWMSLALGKAAGFDVPETALIPMPDGMLPALVVERFDIRKVAGDNSFYAMEDLCSVLDLAPDAKYSGTIERIARAIRPLSTDPDADTVLLLKRALFAWLIADGDMHLKNMALLKIAEPGEKTFRSVRLAPLYDAVTTRVFPRLAHDRMALKLNGKDERLRRADFLATAATIGLRAADANAAMDDLLQRLEAATRAVVLPQLSNPDPEGQAIIARMLDLCRSRIDAFE